MTYSLRPETDSDTPFVRQILIAHMAQGLGAADWPEPLRDQLLGMQYSARRRSIAANYPTGLSQIIVVDGANVGWLVVAELPTEVRLVEIMVDSAIRGRGVGNAVIRDILTHASQTGKPVRLSVDGSNAGARALYERLGFRHTGGDGIQDYMEV